ncbi:MAG: protein TolQ [Deltaproteobacteria bacterium]|nr:MAG: protein TolQ [Deltaproteobacteria bacterium]
MSTFELLFGGGPIVVGTLLLLVFMSIGCWAIILLKGVQFLLASSRSSRFLDAFWKSKRLDEVYDNLDSYGSSPIATVFKQGYQELLKVTKGGRTKEGAADNLQRTLRRAAAHEMTSLERWIAFLATTGSTAPFIGLFGTVWGILQAFNKLGAAQQATIQVVGPDIAHALIATAVGLVAAIPAVMGFNYFNTRLRVMHTEMDNFSSDFLNIVKRHLN